MKCEIRETIQIDRQTLNKNGMKRRTEMSKIIKIARTKQTNKQETDGYPH